MKYRDTAFRAAREAGKIALKYFDQDIKFQTKTRGDVVSLADTESEARIIDIIRSDFPKHSIFSEETKMQKRESEFLWVVDPLDGTSNFMLGIPYFSVSLALMKGNQTILGVIYDPVQDKLYHAMNGKGAFVNNRRIQASSNRKKPIVSLIVGYTAVDRQYNALTKLMKNSYRVITNWSPALDFCLLAQGKIDGIVALENEMEDTVAGMLIAREAKALILDSKNKPYNPSFREVNDDFIAGIDKETIKFLSVFD